MTRVLRKIAFFGALAIAVLGLIIMLMRTDEGETPHYLENIALALIFIVGLATILFLVRNKGIS